MLGLPAVVPAAGSDESCSDDGDPPVEVAVTAVPIVVASTTEDYFVLYVRHEVAGTARPIPVAVTLGQSGTTTLAENVPALPPERYRVEKYRVDAPADLDGDCIDDITELMDPMGMNPVNKAALDPVDGAVIVPDRATFEMLSYSLTGTFHLKFVLFDLDTPRPGIYWMNARTHAHHQKFLDSLGLARVHVIVGQIVLDPSFTAPNGMSGAYYYFYERPLEYSLEIAETIHTVLAANLSLLDHNLVFFLRNSFLRWVQDELPLFRESRMPLVFEKDLFPESNFISLNPGEGYGRLRSTEPNDRPHPRDVVIYESLPNELPRVAGIISTVPQTKLSHVNLRAIQNDIPNAFVRGALTRDDVTRLLGSYVRYTVARGGWNLRSATVEEVNAHYAASRPPSTQTPERDLSVTKIARLSDLGFESWRAFGVKAANVAVLGTLGFPEGTVPDGFAIPFFFYDKFMKANELDHEVDAMLADPDFQTNFEMQETMLGELRDAIEDAETPEWITEAPLLSHKLG